jgi:8-hydroxy-5-deazaflavin:NADPH oxidoreductase
MRVGVIGAGNIGGNIARRLALANHSVIVSFSHDQAKLESFAKEIRAAAGTPKDAAAADVVVVSVPWDAIDDALEQTGSLAGRIVVDTTNQFGENGLVDLGGKTAARINADRMRGARYTKSFNTLTSRFQSESAGRPKDTRVVQWLCGDDAGAKQTLARLIDDAGYVPMDLGNIDGCSVMEAPRRAGAVYGEEYRLVDAERVVDAVRAGKPIPPPPKY